MSGWPASAFPAAPSPCTRVRTPCGSPASRHSPTMNSATAGVSSEGLNTTVFPASRAGTIWPFGRWAGKL